MADAQLLELAAIWAWWAEAGMRGADQTSWYYAMQAVMKELHA